MTQVTTSVSFADMLGNLDLAAMDTTRNSLADFPVGGGKELPSAGGSALPDEDERDGHGLIETAIALPPEWVQFAPVPASSYTAPAETAGRETDAEAGSTRAPVQVGPAPCALSQSVPATVHAPGTLSISPATDPQIGIAPERSSSVAITPLVPITPSPDTAVAIARAPAPSASLQLPPATTAAHSSPVPVAHVAEAPRPTIGAAARVEIVVVENLTKSPASPAVSTVQMLRDKATQPVSEGIATPRMPAAFPLAVLPGPPDGVPEFGDALSIRAERRSGAQAKTVVALAPPSVAPETLPVIADPVPSPASPQGGAGSLIASPSAQPAPPVAVAAVIERLIEARQAAAGDRVKLSVAHDDFGTVHIRFEQPAGAGPTGVELTSSDPGFAPAVQAALAQTGQGDRQSSTNDQPQLGRFDQATGRSDGSPAGGNAGSHDARSRGGDARTTRNTDFDFAQKNEPRSSDETRTHQRPAHSRGHYA